MIYILLLIFFLLGNAYNLNKFNVYKDNADLNIKPLYVVIWKQCPTCTILLKNMKKSGLNTFFANMRDYSDAELNEMYDKHVSKVDFNYLKEPWIFKDDDFIGGLSQIYNLLDDH